VRLAELTNEELDAVAPLLGPAVVQLVHDYRSLHRAASVFHANVIDATGESTVLNWQLLMSQRYRLFSEQTYHLPTPLGSNPIGQFSKPGKR
jgi:hypothetical protein